MNKLELKLNYRLLSNQLPKKLDKKKKILLLDSFALYMKDVYLSAIEESIYNNRYQGQWEPIDDEEYLEYIGEIPDANILDYIIEYMEIRKSTAFYHIGINPHAKYPKKGKYTLLKVLNSIEYGTSKFNARPLFRRVLLDIKRNQNKLFKAYLFRKGVL